MSSRTLLGVCAGAFIGVSFLVASAGAVSATPDVASAVSVPSTVARSSGTDRGAWTWPVPEPRVLKRPFDPPDHEYGPGHRGIDVGAVAGSPVSSPAPGVVLFAGPVAGRSVITVDHGGGVVSSYDPVIPLVAPGATVAPGTMLGTLESGDAMHCSDGCLHLGVRFDGRYVDPLPFFGRPTRSVLLPLAG